MELKEQKAGSYIFMRFRFSVLSTWYQLNKDFKGLMDAFHETARYIESCEVELPSTVLANLYLQMTPKLVAYGQCAEAEAHLSRIIEAEQEGTHNWNLLMLQKASLGLISGK